jgi:peptidyl-prolyl cis-trans isomerase C
MDLQGGAPFAEVAERHSDCKGNGGDLGCFPRGAMVEEFDQVVFAMQPGQCSPIFRTPFGFHIAEVRSKEPGALMDLGELRPIIERYLAAVHERNALQRATAALFAKADVRRVATREAEPSGAQRAAG